MRAQLPKVLHELGGEPILGHVITIAKSLQHVRIHVVTAPDAHAVRKYAQGRGCNCIEQPHADGTAGAALIGASSVPDNAVILVLFADLPLLRAPALRKLVAAARAGGLAVRTMETASPAGYGRIIRDADGNFTDLITHQAATTAQRRIREVDAGGMAFPAEWGKRALAQVKSQLVDCEKPLTDLIVQARDAGIALVTTAVSAQEGMGVNTPTQLLAAQACVSADIVARLVEQGVLFAAPTTVVIHGRLLARPGAFIDRNVVFSGVVRMAAASSIGPNCVITDTVLANGARVHAFSHVVGATLAKDAQAGPFARLRPGSCLGAGSKVGNFVEVKQTKLGAGSKANHLAYLGDGDIGVNVNIGAGTVLCNYDGVDKHLTKIDAGSFVGSGSMLVAPVVVGADALVAAGSVITKDVPAGRMGIARGQQRNVAKRLRRRKAAARR